jgi:hypothetical protein
MPAMQAAAQKAIELDPLLAEGHAALGMTYARVGKWQQAEQCFRRAIELDASSSTTRTDFATNLLQPLGRVDEALREMRAAERADPLSPAVHLYFGYVLLAAGRYEEAVQVCQQVFSDDAHKNECVGRARAQQGKFSDAIPLLEHSGNLAARFRMYRIRQLAERYYAKANAQGQAERRKVLTKAYYAVLSGVFAGDWMAFLRYLGETPHPNEQVGTALPETRLYVTDTSKVAAVATVANISPAEVQRMVAAFWNRPGVAVSPIEERIAVLRRYWQVFDEIHTQQELGMESLWGLIGTRGLLNLNGGGEGLYRQDLYRSLLTESLVAEIENLWSGTTLPMHSEIVVTEIFPHALMAETFGPALDFWHGCALTAWFIAEGPWSRTDMVGLAHQYRKHLAELEDVGCSVNPKLFHRLIEVEATLGPPQPIEGQQSTTQSSGGLSITTSIRIGSRRGGFEKLRDVITQYRTEWAEKNLEQYLRARWERQLKVVAEDYNCWLHEKGRPPTLKQFAKVAAEVANHWFGGDLTGVYGVIGEKILQRPTRRTIMPPDRLGFAQSVYKAIGGQPIERRILAQSRNQAQPTEQQREYSLDELARLSLPYIQLEEALGRSPTLKEFGESRFEPLGQILAENTEEAWKKYGEAIHTVMESPRPPAFSSTENVVMSAAPATVRESPSPLNLAAPPEVSGHRVDIEVPKPKSWFRRLFGH